MRSDKKDTQGVNVAETQSGGTQEYRGKDTGLGQKGGTYKRAEKVTKGPGVGRAGFQGGQKGAEVVPLDLLRSIMEAG